VVSLIPGWKGLPCALGAPRLFAVANEVPASNKAAATEIRADFIMLLLAVVARFGTITGKGKDWQREKPGRATGCVSGRQPQRISGDPHRNYQSRGQRD
jgi:hypothetical protein